jgi:nitrogen fixation NifU-like protein
MFEGFDHIYGEVILDHDRKPRNYHVLKNATQSAQGYNPACSDNITLYLKVENDVIEDASFSGTSCAICRASASMLTDAVKGQTRSEAEELFGRVRQLMMTGKTEGEVGKLVAFSMVHRQLNRIKCAILPWHALHAALKGEGQEPVSTENENQIARGDRQT